MQETNPLSNYNGPITYFGIAHTLTEEDNDRFSSLDATIQERLKDVVYLAPRGSRHITIMNLSAVVGGYRDKDTVEFFDAVANQYQGKLESIANKFSTFNVIFNTLEVHANAIIIRGSDNGQMARIRNELLDLPRLDGRLIDPGFIHSTQARYKNRVSIDEVKEQLSDISIDIPITIDRLELVRADTSFSKPHTVLEGFKLAISN